MMSYDGASAGQAATQNLPVANNLVVFMGGDHGFLSLVAQLRGHDLSVDAMGTGFAFVLSNTLSLVAWLTVPRCNPRRLALSAGEC